MIVRKATIKARESYGNSYYFIVHPDQPTFSVPRAKQNPSCYLQSTRLDRLSILEIKKNTVRSDGKGVLLSSTDHHRCRNSRNRRNSFPILLLAIHPATRISN